MQISGIFAKRYLILPDACTLIAALLKAKRETTELSIRKLSTRPTKFLSTDRAEYIIALKEMGSVVQESAGIELRANCQTVKTKYVSITSIKLYSTNLQKSNMTVKQAQLIAQISELNLVLLINKRRQCASATTATSKH